MPKNSRKPGKSLTFSKTAPRPPALATPSVSTATSTTTITMACIKSDALSAKKPPSKVYISTNAAPTSIIVIYGAPNSVENSLPQVTRQLAAYTVKNTSINAAEMPIMTFFFS